MSAWARACTSPRRAVRARKPRGLPADSGPFELIRARWLIESRMRCAGGEERQPGTDPRDARKRSTRCSRSQAQGVMPLANDRLFHLRIAEASGNSALALVVQTLWDQRTGPLFLQLEHHFDTPDLWDAAIAEHRRWSLAIASARRRQARADDAPSHGPGGASFQKSWTAGRQPPRKRTGSGNGAA